MSADKNRNQQVEEEQSEAAGSAAGDGQAQNAKSAESAESTEKSEKGSEKKSDDTQGGSGTAAEALEARVKEYQEQMLRSQAEMQNVRRRAEIDVEKAHKFALEKFVKELLPVADSLEKAVESTEGHEEAGEVVANIREGVEMTLSLFMNSLSKFNVRQLNPEGEPFDPQQHEAMSMVSAPNAEPNSVVAVVQKGYTLNDRLVRPAMVVIAKAESGPKVDEQA
jgi:molecular chaperone GrpE